MIERLAVLVLVLFGMAGAAAAAPGDCFDADAGNRIACGL